jgi:hypothetical protein
MLHVDILAVEILVSAKADLEAIEPGANFTPLIGGTT